MSGATCPPAGGCHVCREGPSVTLWGGTIYFGGGHHVCRAGPSVTCARGGGHPSLARGITCVGGHPLLGGRRPHTGLEWWCRRGQGRWASVVSVCRTPSLAEASSRGARGCSTILPTEVSSVGARGVLQGLL